VGDGLLAALDFAFAVIPQPNIVDVGKAVCVRRALKSLEQVIVEVLVCFVDSLVVTRICLECRRVCL